MGWLDDIIGGVSDFFGGGGGEAAQQLAGPGVDLAAGAIGEGAGAGAEFGAGLADVAKEAGGAAAGGGGSWFPNMNAAGDKVWGGVKGGWQGAGDVLGGLGGVAKAALPAAQLGAMGMGAYSSTQAAKAANEQAKIQRHAQQLQEQAAVPLTNFGAAQLKNAQAGKVPEAVEAQIQQWKQGALQQTRDLFARMGMPVGTSESSAEQLVEQQATAMRANFLQTEAQQGIGALQAGGGQAGAMGQSAEHQQSSLDSIIANANQALARLAAGTAS